jgi:phage terminase large subunit-like protein
VTPASLTAEMIEAFAGVYLSPRYDQPQPTPDFHREAWEYYCTDRPACALAAPRNHAKTTALTDDYILANACFRVEEYIIVMGASEEMAVERLGDITMELKENDYLREAFKIKAFLQEQKTDIIVECTDGYQFRILARGAEQKIRGRKWRGKRPGLIVCDDLEDDEQVESRDRRRKFSHWFFRAARQALRDGGRIRVHGTILHEDSLLANLIKQWRGKLYKAHRSFDEFTNILWIEKFPETRLREIRQEFIERGDAPGYSGEYLNDPFDSDECFIRREDLLPMTAEDHGKLKKYCVAADFAVSKADSANRSALSVGGKDMDNFLHKVDNRVGRWDILELIEEMFSVQIRWKPEIFWVEDGAIWKAIWPIIRPEMRKRDVWINFKPIPSTKDKATRGRSFQKRTRAGGFKVDKEASWYPAWENEILRFTGITEATLDDQFDAESLLCRGFEDFYDIELDDLLSDEILEWRELAEQARGPRGRNQYTGY